MNGEIIAGIVGGAAIIVTAILKFAPGRPESDGSWLKTTEGGCPTVNVVSKELCDERSGNIQKTLNGLDSKVDRLLDMNGGSTE